MFSQVSVTIDTCQFLELARKKKLMYTSEKNTNGTGSVNELKLNNCHDNVFLKPSNDLTESIIHFHRYLVYKEYLCKLQGK